MKNIILSQGTRTGIFFGTTSGVITTVGLLTGLNASTHSVAAVLGGILVIAVADALSDALGIHLAQESDPGVGHDDVWAATIATFLSKFIVAASFAVPLLLLSLHIAVVVAILWGLLIITVLSYNLARRQTVPVLPVIAEHVGIAVVVIVISHYIGVWVGRAFGS